MVYTRSDFLHPVQFCSSKEGPDNTVQSQPGSGLDGLVKFWPNGSGLDGLVMFWPNGSGLDGLVKFWPNESGLDGLVKFWPNGSGLDGLVKFWPNGSGVDGLVKFWPNGSGVDAIIIRPGSGRMQLAHCQFYTFRHDCLLPQIILCKTNMDPIWFWLTVLGFGQTDLVWMQSGVQESSGLLLSRSGSGANQIGHVY